MNNTGAKLNRAWERLIGVYARDEEEARLGRLFNTLMVVSLGISLAISFTVLLMQPLGLLTADVSWEAAAFPLFFVPLSVYCLAQAKRGRVRSMVQLYVWVNFVAIVAAVTVFDGIRSPVWLLFAWNITIAGILLAPAYALRLTGGVVAYFMVLACLYVLGIYQPPLSFGAGGREFLGMALTFIVLVSTVGLLTFLNMRSLHESEQKLVSITASAQDGIAMIDDEGKIVFFNEAAQRIFGYTAPEVIGRNLHQLLAPARYLDDHRRAFPHFAKTGAGDAVGKTLELGALRKDGSEFPIELSLAAIHVKGRWNAVGIIRDITERKQAEEAVRVSSLKHQLLFESSRDALMTLAPPSWKFTGANRATLQLFGATSVDEFTALGPWDVSPALQPDGRLSSEKAQEMIATAMREGSNYFEWEHQRLDGQPFAADVLLTRMEVGDEQFLQATVRDISERKQAEAEIRKLNMALETKVQERTQQLLEAQKELVQKEKLALLGQVAGSVGHELRNPLGVMSNAVFFLQTVLPDTNETIREYLNIIRKEISGSERIVSDLLDAVRTRQPNPATTGVAELVGQALREYGMPDSVSVSLDIPAEIMPLRVDPQQIRMVLSKLISNAVDVMPQGGVLGIKAREDTHSRSVSISVSDTGPGIAPENLGKLFQPLFTTKARGIGLGLVVVKNLIAANGGKIEVQSTPGQGTVFSVTLPSAGTAGQTA